MSDQPIQAARYPRIRTTISISVSAWKWLRQRAEDEAEAEGGRPNASAILERLIRDGAERT